MQRLEENLCRNDATHFAELSSNSRVSKSEALPNCISTSSYVVLGILFSRTCHVRKIFGVIVQERRGNTRSARTRLKPFSWVALIPRLKLRVWRFVKHSHCGSTRLRHRILRETSTLTLTLDTRKSGDLVKFRLESNQNAFAFTGGRNKQSRS